MEPQLWSTATAFIIGYALSKLEAWKYLSHMRQDRAAIVQEREEWAKERRNLLNRCMAKDLGGYLSMENSGMTDAPEIPQEELVSPHRNGM